MVIAAKLFNMMYNLIHMHSDNKDIKKFADTLRFEYPKESDEYIEEMAALLYKHNRGI